MCPWLSTIKAVADRRTEGSIENGMSEGHHLRRALCCNIDILSVNFCSSRSKGDTKACVEGVASSFQTLPRIDSGISQRVTLLPIR